MNLLVYCSNFFFFACSNGLTICFYEGRGGCKQIRTLPEIVWKHNRQATVSNHCPFLYQTVYNIL